MAFKPVIDGIPILIDPEACTERLTFFNIGLHKCQYCIRALE